MRLDREFYVRDTLTVARELLGKVLVHETAAGPVKGRIVEVEAYCGTRDKAAHAYSGVPTGRTRVQFREGGYAYVYMIYGIYHCLNLVTEQKGVGECVLIRALEPLVGMALMEERRGTKEWRNLCSGPGKLCQAFGIDRSLNGANLCAGGFYVEEAEGQKPFTVKAGPRIGIDYAGEAVDFPWRFYIEDNACVSGKKKSHR